MELQPLTGNQMAMATGHRRYPFATHHMYSGPVGSGKSTMGLIDFFDWVREQPAGRRYGLLGPTHGRVTALLEENAELFRYEPPRTGVQTWRWNGRVFDLRPTESIRAEARIRGSNWAGAYVDEATLAHKSAMAQVQARLRVGRNPKLYATMNPAGPRHWLRGMYLHPKPPRVHIVESQVEDNPSLPPGYKQSLARVYRGAMYERMVLGRWVAAAGEIWLVPDDVTPPEGPPDRVMIGVDDARSGIAFALALGQWGKRSKTEPWYAIGEWAKPAGHRMEASERAEVIAAWAFARWAGRIDRVFVDPSADELIKALRVEGLRVRAAENAQLAGIGAVDRFFVSDRLRVTRRVPEARASWEGYQWDPNAALLGEDRPLKDGEEHAADALRYVVMGIDQAPQLIW